MQLISLNYYIVCFPFNTNKNSTYENDILVYNDILAYSTVSNKFKSPHHFKDNFYLLESYNNDDALAIFKTFNYCISMRFHPCLYSIYSGVPFMPVYSTRKIKNLILDFEWKYFLEMDSNIDKVPTNINPTDLMHMFRTLVDNEIAVKKQLVEINKNIDHSFMKGIAHFIDIIKDPVQPKKNWTNRVDAKLKFIKSKITEYAETKGYPDFRLIQDTKLQDLIIKMVSFYLTDSTYSIYNYGLKEKMFSMNYNFQTEWSWIHYNNLLNNPKLPSNPKGLYNISFIGPSRSQRFSSIWMAICI